VLGVPYMFLSNLFRPVEEFNSGSGSGAVMFQIGRALNGHVNVERIRIFGDVNDFKYVISPANSAISFYKVTTHSVSSCSRHVESVLSSAQSLQGSSHLDWQDGLGES
jgi:hypothetical protein